MEELFSEVNNEPESAINLAQLYWQGLYQKLDLKNSFVFLLTSASHHKDPFKRKSIYRYSRCHL